MPLIFEKTMRSGVLILAWLLLSLSARPAAGDDQAPLLLGGISVLSGEGAAWGVNHRRGTELGIEEVNRNGGVRGRPLAVVFEDSPSGLARHALTAYRSLVSRHRVRFIFGPLMGDELLSIAPLALRDRVFLLGATYMPEVPDNFFSTWIDPKVEARLIAERIAERHSTLAVLGSQQSWELLVAEEVAKQFRALGKEVVAFESPVFDAADVGAEVLRASKKQPQAVFISSYYLLSRYLKELSRLSVKAPLFSIELDRSAVELGGAAIEGLEFVGPKPMPEAFVARFRERFGESPDIPAAHAYDAAVLLGRALSQTDGSFEQVKRYFEELSVFDGVTGVLGNASPGTAARTAWFRVEKGAVVTIPH